MSRAAEWVFREHYGRLLSVLAASVRDIHRAEDALSQALLEALEAWGTRPPENPEAWLLTAARRRLIDADRTQRVRADRTDDVRRRLTDLLGDRWQGDAPDRRLELLFACTHPAIAPEAQVGLMLQTVLGLDAEVIASAFLVAPKTMGQRLWRAKEKIRAAHIPFEVPPIEVRAERIDAVLEAIYATFGAGWHEGETPAEASHEGLRHEAIFLARTLVTLLGDQTPAEALGLLALMLFSEARAPARLDDQGVLVPPHRQNPERWLLPLMVEAEGLLNRAAALREVGPFQLEAVIHATHVRQRREGRRDPRELGRLYDALLILVDSLGARVARAALHLEAGEIHLADQTLGQIAGRCTDFQPWWAVHAAVLHAAGRAAEAREAYDRALGLSRDEPTRRFLRAERARIDS